MTNKIYMFSEAKIIFYHRPEGDTSIAALAGER